MKTNEADGGSQLSRDKDSLRREGRWWRWIFQGRQGVCGHEQGALKGMESEVQSPLSAECGVRSAESGKRGRHFVCASAEYLSRFLCAALSAAVLTGCAGPAPLKGGKAVLSRRPGGVVEETLVQSENPAQSTRQDRQSLKVRTYTVPAGSRMEACPTWAGERPREPKLSEASAECGMRTAEWAREEARLPGTHPSTLNPQPSTTFTLSAPMPVVEREESRAKTELGAAQRDTAREVGARLASLKGVVWVGVGLFILGLASLVWPPLKVAVGSVTTSAAMMLGGVALMVLPSLIVGNELLIFGVVALAVGTYFLAHRHGHLRGQLRSTDHGTDAYRQSRTANH